MDEYFLSLDDEPCNDHPELASFSYSNFPNKDWINVTVENEVIRGEQMRKNKYKQSEIKEYKVVDVDFKAPKKLIRKRKRRQNERTKLHSFNAPNSKISRKKFKQSVKECPLRIETLALPSKRLCLDTWRHNSHILPANMIIRLKQHLLNERPKVQVSEAIEYFKTRKTKKKHSLSKQKIVDKVKKNDWEVNLFCGVLGYRIMCKLMKPLNLTLTTESLPLFEIVQREISQLLKKNSKTDKFIKNRKLLEEISKTVTLWMSNVLQDANYLLLLDDLNDLEEKHGHIFKLVDDIFDNSMVICLPTTFQSEEKRSDYFDDAKDIKSETIDIGSVDIINSSRETVQSQSFLNEEKTGDTVIEEEKYVELEGEVEDNNGTGTIEQNADFNENDNFSEVNDNIEEESFKIKSVESLLEEKTEIANSIETNQLNLDSDQGANVTDEEEPKTILEEKNDIREGNDNIDEEIPQTKSIESVGNVLIDKAEHENDVTEILERHKSDNNNEYETKPEESLSTLITDAYDHDDREMMDAIDHEQNIDEQKIIENKELEEETEVSDVFNITHENTDFGNKNVKFETNGDTITNQSSIQSDISWIHEYLAGKPKQVEKISFHNDIPNYLGPPNLNLLYPEDEKWPEELPTSGTNLVEVISRSILTLGFLKEEVESKTDSSRPLNTRTKVINAQNSVDFKRENKKNISNETVTKNFKDENTVNAAIYIDELKQKEITDLTIKRPKVSDQLKLTPKPDYRVNMDNAPSWVLQVIGRKNVDQNCIFQWCTDLENTAENLLNWSDWIMNTCDNILALKQTKCLATKDEIEFWEKINYDVDSELINMERNFQFKKKELKKLKTKIIGPQCNCRKVKERKQKLLSNNH